MEMTLANLRWHVATMAKRFDIAVIERTDLERHEAFSFRFRDEVARLGIPVRSILVRRIDDESSYAVAMHEMGHHLAPNGYGPGLDEEPKPGCHPRERFEYYQRKLIAEEAAWEWARYYIEQVFIWTAAMEQTKEYGLSSYREARRLGR